MKIVNVISKFLVAIISPIVFCFTFAAYFPYFLIKGYEQKS